MRLFSWFRRAPPPPLHKPEKDHLLYVFYTHVDGSLFINQSSPLRHEEAIKQVFLAFNQAFFCIKERPGLTIVVPTSRVLRVVIKLSDEVLPEFKNASTTGIGTGERVISQESP